MQKRLKMTTFDARDAVWDVDSGGSKEPCIRWGANWRNLANTTEPSMRGGDAALPFCHSTLTTDRRTLINRATRSITANMQVDGQCDKLATELS